MRKLKNQVVALLTATLLVMISLSGCDTVDNQLLPYEGSRPLIVQGVTTSFAPDISWVGGRVAAVGINRGETAALDSTLVWMHRADNDGIDSPIFVREMLDAAAVENVGGTPTDSLVAGETYTVWLATAQALEAGLDSTLVDDHHYADSTFTADYLLRGRSFGGVDVEFSIFRDQRIVSNTYTATWTPADQAFRRIAIRNATVGGFDNLMWHIVLPEDQPDTITSPLVIGSAPDNAIVATEWEGFAEGAHTFWAATDEWNGTEFGFGTQGYAFFQIFPNNFE